MGLPARMIDTDYGPVRSRARTVVPKKSARARRACDLEASARAALRIFLVVTLVITALGIARVWLSVQAAEASLEANRLRNEIEAERYRGDMLEVQQSALGSPSRIRAIACATMDMAPADKVTYLDIEQPVLAEDAAAAPSRPTAERVLADLLNLAAGEAQVLLVGDVGLAQAR